MSSGSIQLHKPNCINPHMTFCPQCGGEGREIILLGAKDSVGHCDNCSLDVIGAGKCPKCKTRTRVVRKIEDHERLPGSLCEKCEAEQKKFAEAVAAGGVYWRCIDCKREGVIKATVPYAKTVREALKLPAPTPCGVEFKEPNCPACGPNKVV